MHCWLKRGCQTNDKIGRFYLPTKSPDFVGQDRACSIFDDIVGRLLVYRTTNFVYVAMVIVYNGRWIFILVIYCVCYYFRSLDAEKKWVLFCDLHSAVVLADNVWSSRQNYQPCVMVHRFCRPILSGNSTTPTKVGRLCRSSDIPFTYQIYEKCIMCMLNNVPEHNK